MIKDKYHKDLTFNKHLSTTISPDTKIYRIISLETLVKMFENNSNVLVKTMKWDDPYENFYLKLLIDYNGQTGTMSNVIDSVFGQSWSLHQDTDAMWRIYSSDTSGVQIQTTIQKLFDSVYISDKCMATTTIGDVEYYNEQKLSDWVDNHKDLTYSTIGKNITESQYIKRDSFSHEKEVRVIYQCDSTNPDNKAEVKSYVINPLDFIESVRLDPRSNDTYMQIVKAVLAQYSYPQTNISKSDLYENKLITSKILTLK